MPPPLPRHSSPIQSPSPFLLANLCTVQIYNTSVPSLLSDSALLIVLLSPSRSLFSPSSYPLISPPSSPLLSLFIYQHPSCLETAGLCLETRSSRWPRKPSLAWRPWNTCEYPTMLGCPSSLPARERERERVRKRVLGGSGGIAKSSWQRAGC